MYDVVSQGAEDSFKATFFVTALLEYFTFSDL